MLAMLEPVIIGNARRQHRRPHRYFFVHAIVHDDRNWRDNKDTVSLQQSAAPNVGD